MDVYLKMADDIKAGVVKIICDAIFKRNAKYRFNPANPDSAILWELVISDIEKCIDYNLCGEDDSQPTATTFKNREEQL